MFFLRMTNRTSSKVVRRIRKIKPEIVLATPDTTDILIMFARRLAFEACFPCSLAKIETTHEGVSQEVCRPKPFPLHTEVHFFQPGFCS